MKIYLTLLFLPYLLLADICPSYFNVRDISKKLIQFELDGGIPEYYYGRLKNIDIHYLNFKYKKKYIGYNKYYIENKYNYTIVSIQKLEKDKFRVNYKLDAFLFEATGTDIIYHSLIKKFNLSLIFKLNSNRKKNLKGCVEYVDETISEVRTRFFISVHTLNAG